jgi:hypothetical protein
MKPTTLSATTAIAGASTGSFDFDKTRAENFVSTERRVRWRSSACNVLDYGWIVGNPYVGLDRYREVPFDEGFRLRLKAEVFVDGTAQSVLAA